LTFALGKTTTLPTPPPPSIREPVKVAQFADASTIQLGHSRYLRTCVACHGFDAVSGGLVPDLRYSYAITDKDVFKSIVLDGVDKDRGMISFAQNFSPAEVEAIRAYLIDRASIAPAIGRKP
jgi:quinohemoprotein ethanol dehydrogenase